MGRDRELFVVRPFPPERSAVEKRAGGRPVTEPERFEIDTSRGRSIATIVRSRAATTARQGEQAAKHDPEPPDAGTIASPSGAPNTKPDFDSTPSPVLI
jgi:hypothetical protein